MINNNRQGSVAPVVIAVVSAAVIILFLLGWYPQTWFKNLFGGSDKLALIGSFGDFKEGATIDDVAKTIVADLISAQSNSKTENNKWGGCFRNPAGGSDFYDIVSNILVSPDDACTIGGSVTHKSNNNLPNGIEFLAPEGGKFISVVFNVNGTTNSNRDIVLKISNGIDSRFIIITPLGFITYGLTTEVASAPAPTPSPVPVINRTTVVKPTAPVNVSALSGNGAVTVSWSAPAFSGNAPVAQYRIYRSFVSNGVRSIAGTTSPNTFSFTDTGLVNGANYYYRVTASNFLFEGTESTEAAGTPSGPTTTFVPPPQQQCPGGYTGAYPNCYPPYQANSVPSAPRNLSADGDDNEIDLSWSAPSSNGGSSVSSYRIYRANSSGGNTYYLNTVDDSDREYTDSGLPSGTTYYYYVTAVNSIGESSFSNRDSATTDNRSNQQCQSGYTGTYPNCSPVQQQSSVPSAPSNLSAVGGQTQINLSWNAPSNNGGSSIINYKIYRAYSTYNTPIFLNQTSARNYTDNGIPNGTTYYYWVLAVNSTGESNFSNQASATAQASSQQTGCGSTAPANLSATPDSNTTDAVHDIVLSWSAVTPASGCPAIVNYTVYRLDPGTNSTQHRIHTTSNNTTLTFNDTGLTKGSTYHYWVSAYDGSDQSNLSWQAIATAN